MNYRHMWLGAACAALMPAAFAQGSILTFDQALPITNDEAISQNYGDRITSATMGSNQYDLFGGATPNILLSYGPAIANPALYSTGYGDLTNVLLHDDTNPSLTITFTADPGYLVRLICFDMAAYGGVFAASPTINSMRITDGNGAVLFEQLNPTINKFTHTEFYFPTWLTAPVINLTFDSGNLGSNSDDVAIDKIVFVQAPVPEPATGLLLLGGATALLRRRRKAS